MIPKAGTGTPGMYLMAQIGSSSGISGFQVEPAMITRTDFWAIICFGSGSLTHLYGNHPSSACYARMGILAFSTETTKKPFTFAGVGSPLSVADEIPVRVLWSLRPASRDAAPDNR